MRRRARPARRRPPRHLTRSTREGTEDAGLPVRRKEAATARESDIDTEMMQDACPLDLWINKLTLNESML